MDAAKVAALANLPLTSDQIAAQTQSLSAVMGLVDHISALDVTNVEPTSQVTGLTNVTRADKIDTTRMFTQKQALSGAKSVHDGYFLVPSVFQEQ